VQESSGHERWLVSYADFITLLFAFFVVLYASAQLDNKKVAQVSAAIKGAFEQLGVFTGSGPGNGDLPKKVIFIQGSGGGAPQFSIPAPGASSTIVTSGRPGEQTNSAASPSQGSAVDTAALKRQLEEALGDEIKQQKVQMRVGPDGLVVSLREIGFFDSGESKLLPEAKPTITRLAKVLEQKDFEIRVEGHTDNVPIHTARFSSNWELSTARATEVVSMLVRDHGFDPRDVSVAGYAEFRPVFSNDTEEGRKANRRIDLVVIGFRKASPPATQSLPAVSNKPGVQAPR
jgi:chemotaxis protein MotB